jgi:transcriptional regulator with XRE-family HTH domain
MSINPYSLTIRAKKLGVLIRDARLATRKSVQECADVLGILPTEFEAYEMGETSPSLPKLEVMAFFFGVPLNHFWGNKAISEDRQPAFDFNVTQLLSLRQRMLGALVRQARTQSGVSLETLAGSLNLSPGQLDSFELGEFELPMPVFEAMIHQLQRPLEDFNDQHGPIGTRSREQQTVQDFLKLPSELQSFVAKPVNRPYLELAQRLSEMSVDKLRSVGEGILEITL